MTDLIIDERRAVELVGLLGTIKDEIAPLREQERLLGDQLKQYMALEGLNELADGETGMVARLQDRAGTRKYDLISAAEQHPDMVIAAAAAGMLSLDHTMLQRLRHGGGSRWADVLAEYGGPGPGSTVLTIARGK